MIVLFTVLILLVILVNGLTDAPNAIAGCIGSRSLSPGAALALAAVCNFAGAVGMAFLHSGVAKTVFGMVDFGEDAHTALGAICAALCTVILWGAVAWHFGLPTSETHALLSGMTGAALAQHMSTDAIHVEEWNSVLWGLFAATLPACLLGFLFYRVLLILLSDVPRRKAIRRFSRAQRFGAAGSALLHGAQDSQKFMGVYLLGLSLYQPQAIEGDSIPISVIFLCAGVMTFGTLLGGSKIIKKVGCEMTDLDAVGGSASDAASAVILTVCSLLGIPVGTTHSKSCAMMGTGLCRKGNVNWRIVGQMAAAWVLTFPVCGAGGFFLSLLMT